MTLFHYLGAALVLILITAVGIYSGRKIKSSSDFSSGGKSGGVLVTTGSLVGTLVGGASTIGTAQLAFNYGFSAWWFTLGGGIGLFALAFIFAKPFYNSGKTTISQILISEYGKKAATWATVLMSVGTFLSIVSQLLSGTALISSISPIGALPSTVITIGLMMAYVVFGGVWGAGMTGIVKTLLLYASTLLCGIVAIRLGGGVNAFYSALPSEQYFNLFARGIWKDGGAGLSLLFGVLTTQAYILPIVSAKNLNTSKRGALLGGVLTVLIGIAGIFVGMYMKLNQPDIDSAIALPKFVTEVFPPFIGGIILAALFVALVGTGAGLSLGISSMATHDIYQVFIKPDASDKEKLNFSRLVIVAVLILAALFSFGNIGSMILNWSFMSMGLRASVAFAPLCLALFFPNYTSKKGAMAAIIVSPVTVLIGKFILPPHIDSLFLGMLVSIIIMLVCKNRNNK